MRSSQKQEKAQGSATNGYHLEEAFVLGATLDLSLVQDLPAKHRETLELVLAFSLSRAVRTTLPRIR